MKKTIAFMLVLSLILSLGVSALAADETALPFDDVKSGSWYYDAVSFVYAEELIDDTDAAFCPDEPLTQAVFAAALNRLAGQEIISDTDGGPQPEDNVSREQMVADIARYVDTLPIALRESETGVGAFADANEVSENAQEGLTLLRTSGIIRGDENQNFSPKKDATRAEAAVVLMRLDTALKTATPKPGVATAITNVRIFDGFKMSERTTVVMEDGLISDKTEGDITIDGKGGFLMPGLIDAHAHPKTAGDLKQSVSYGVTSTFALSAGAEIRDCAGLTRIWSSYASALGDVTDAKAFVASEVANVADFIKVIIEDPAVMASETITLEVLKEIVSEAHKNNLLVTAHVVAVPTAQMAVDAGVDILIHLPLEAPMPQSLVDQLAEQGTTIVPTLVMMEAFALSDRYGYKDEDYLNTEITIGMLLKAGVPIMAGTDANSTSYVPDIHYGVDLHREMALLVKAGMTPLQILEGATSLSARLFGFTQVGAIEPGRRADLILVEGSPDSDISEISNIQRVWIGGVEVYTS